MIETILRAIAPSIIVGLVLFYWERRQKKQDSINKEQEAVQMSSDMLRLDLEVATAQLSYAVAIAYKRGAPNGEMEAAIKKYDEAMTNFREFERKQLVLNNRN